MLSWFPTPYPDELWYSVLCRYYMYSGHTSKKTAMDNILPNGQTLISAYYALRLDELCQELFGEWTSPQKIIEHHTLYPYYSRFLSIERKEKAIGAMVGKIRLQPSIILGARTRNGHERVRCWRYCPLCAKEDMEKYGETYWHRIHQIQDLRICPIHNIFLIETHFLVQSNMELCVPVFPIEKELKGKISHQEIEIAQIIWELLKRPCDMQAHTPRVLLDQPLVDQMYRSLSGRHTDIVRLADMLKRELYDTTDMGNGSLPGDCNAAVIAEMFKPGHNTHTVNVIHLGWLLKMTVEDFLAPTDENDMAANRWEQHIRYLYEHGWSGQKIAEEYSLDRATVRSTLSKFGLYKPIPCKKRAIEQKKENRRAAYRKEIIEYSQLDGMTRQKIKDRTGPYFKVYAWLMKHDKEWVTELVNTLPSEKHSCAYRIDWKQLDEATYPKIVEVLASQNNDPIHLNVICGEVGIKREWLKKMPKCQKRINSEMSQRKKKTSPEK